MCGRPMGTPAHFIQTQCSEGGCAVRRAEPGDGCSRSARREIQAAVKTRIVGSSIGLVHGVYSSRLRVALIESECHVTWMGRKVAVAAIALIAWAGEGHAVAPLHDPVILNVGINCQWQRSCERRQLKAMSSAHAFIARSHPPLWRIQLCNRNARRSISRVDWVGFDDCLRNPRLARPAPRRR